MTSTPSTDTLPTVVTPGDAGYDEQRAGWNLAADQRPAGSSPRRPRATCAPRSPTPPSTTYRRRPGHRPPRRAAAAARASLLLRTELHAPSRSTPTRRRARVKAGALWERRRRGGRAARPGGLHGSSPNVGVVGYLLGGGLASTRAATASPRPRHRHRAGHRRRRAAPRRRRARPGPVLGAARRRGDFGVVTAIEFGLFAHETVFAGIAF